MGKAEATGCAAGFVTLDAPGGKATEQAKESAKRAKHPAEETRNDGIGREKDQQNQTDQRAVLVKWVQRVNFFDGPVEQGQYGDVDRALEQAKGIEQADLESGEAGGVGAEEHKGQQIERRQYSRDEHDRTTKARLAGIAGLDDEDDGEDEQAGQSQGDKVGFAAAAPDGIEEEITGSHDEQEGKEVIFQGEDWAIAVGFDAGGGSGGAKGVADEMVEGAEGAYPGAKETAQE